MNEKHRLDYSNIHFGQVSMKIFYIKFFKSFILLNFLLDSIVFMAVPNRNEAKNLRILIAVRITF